MLQSKREESQGGDYNTVIHKLRGKVQKVIVKDGADTFNPGKTKTDVWLDMIECDVLETDPGTSHPYKTAKIYVGKFSNNARSAWVMLEDSILHTIGCALEDVSVELLEGKVITLEREDGHLFGTKDNNEEMRGKVWRVIECEGVSSVDPFDKALDLLDGMKRGDFISTAASDAIVKSDSQLVTSIIQGSFFTDQRVVDGFTVADDRYTRV